MEANTAAIHHMRSTVQGRNDIPDLGILEETNKKMMKSIMAQEDDMSKMIATQKVKQSRTGTDHRESTLAPTSCKVR